MFGQKSKFFKAIKSGDIETVKRMIAEGMSPNTFKLFRDSPLNEACAAGNIDMVGVLINAGAKIQSGALNRAAQAGNPELIKLLIQHGVNPNEPTANLTPLEVAAMFKHTESIEVLLHSGAELNKRGHLGRTPLFWAVAEGSIDATRKLLSAGANPDLPDNEGDTPLVWVGIFPTNPEMMVELINAGADMGPRVRIVNARREEVKLSLETQDSNKNTLLMIAAKTGKLRAVERLIQAGVEINKINKEGNTALKLALLNGHDEIARYLRENGAADN